MKLTIIHYTVLVVVLVVLFVLNNRKAQRSTSQSSNLTKTHSRAPVPVDATPDDPTPFGYKCIWFAIKSTNMEEVVKEIGLKFPVPCNWKSGIAAAYEGSIFVSPAIGDWILMVGQGLPTLDDADRQNKTDALLVKLSQRFGETQHFGTHRVVEFHTWAKAVGGKSVRKYAYLGERGEKLYIVGEMTEEERAAGIIDSQDFFPNESHVMKVAERWSLDPSELSPKNAEKGVGRLWSL